MGMDTPELPWSEVVTAKNVAELERSAYICPGMVRREGLHIHQCILVVSAFDIVRSS